jgi:hypothetical protein
MDVPPAPPGEDYVTLVAIAAISGVEDLLDESGLDGEAVDEVEIRVTEAAKDK